LRGLLTDFQKCAGQLGLTPSSRKRIGVEMQKKQVESKLMTMRKKTG
jgi:phage terminase small subunit